MEIILFFNGLGNQMSQYAFYLAKKKQNPKVKCIYFPSKYDDQHNGFELDKIFNININKDIKFFYCYFLYCLYLLKDEKGLKGKYIRKILKLLKVNVIYEDFKTYEFNPSYLLKRSGISYYYGGWHTEKYFCEIKDVIYKTFQFHIKENDYNVIQILKEIKTKNSVSIHVRRGDYLNKGLKDIFGNVCNLDYYKKALDYIHQHVEDPFFYIFSDDKLWIKDNLNFPNSEIVDFNKGEDSWKDMYLMSQCKHNINANSTFSWWGAWLNENPNKIVVVPTRFHSQDRTIQFYPEKWIKM